MGATCLVKGRKYEPKVTYSLINDYQAPKLRDVSPLEEPLPSIRHDKSVVLPFLKTFPSLTFFQSRFDFGLDESSPLPPASMTTTDEIEAKPAAVEELSDPNFEVLVEANGRKEQPREEFKLGARGRWVFIILVTLNLMTAIDGTSISVALPIMSRDLGGTALEAFWSGTSFLLCSTVFQPSIAAFSNIFGRRSLTLFSIAFFFVGALLAGIARGFTQVLVGRCIQGVGGGGIVVLSEVIVTDLVPLRLRGIYFGILSAVHCIGAVVGPVIGAAFAQNVSWRWIFYINFPFIGAGTPLVVMFLKLEIPAGSLGEKMRRVDYVGTVLFVGSLSSFLIPLTLGGVMYAWSSWHIVVPLVIGIAGLVAFACYEYKVPAEPMIPHSIFQNRTSTVSLIAGASSGLILWCVLYYMPLYYEGVKGYSPIIAGVALFPETFSVGPAAVISGFVITSLGRYRLPIWGGWVVSVIGLGILCILNVNTSVPGWIFLNLVSGLGIGVLFSATILAVQASTTNENLAIAAAMFTFARSFGQTLGIAIGGVTFQNQMRTNLETYPALAPMAVEYSQDAARLVTIIKSMPDSQTKDELKTAYTDSLRIIWACLCGIAFVTFLLSLLTKSYDLNRVLESTQGLQQEKDRSSDEKGGVVDS
ncbi:MAG: hypothetical protein Q9187_000876 [Circinaria calcarea]